MSRDNSIVDADQDTIGEFLELKGAVELLIVLADGDVPYSKLEDTVPVSKSTFHKRRQQAVELQLIDSGRQQTGDGDGFENVYRLTALGDVVVQRIREAGLVQLFKAWQQIRAQYDEAREEIPVWAENVDSFDNLYQQQFQRKGDWEPDEDFHQ